MQKRSVYLAMKDGLFSTCPNCHQGSLFKSYLQVADSCTHCGQELHHHRADDAPPYFTIFIVGHIVAASALMVEKAYHPALWIHMALWLPLCVFLSLAFLRPIKGSIVGLQWANRMHGFGEYFDDTKHSL